MNKKKAVSINKKTLAIAEESTGKRLILYVWVAINRYLFEGQEKPSLRQLAVDCGTSSDRVREAVSWLEEKGYLAVNVDERGMRRYAVT